MKKLAIFLLLVFTTILFSEIVEIENNIGNELFTIETERSDQVFINFSLDQYEIEMIRENGVNYSRISYEGEGEFAQQGKPDLPRFTRLIAIPDAGEVQFDIVNNVQQVVAGMNIYPRQSLDGSGMNESTSFLIDNDFYNGDQSFPTQLVEVSEPAILRDMRVVSVTINPFSYIPDTGELIITENIEVEITVSGNDGINIREKDKKRSRYFEPMYSSNILNYESMIDRDTEYQQPCYLFIHPDNSQILNYLDVLTEWKHQKGFEVHVVSTTETGTSLNQIKNYIQNAYDNWENPPEFVCLVGDANGSYYLPSSSQGGGVGDQYYALLEGNDILADLFIGRLSFNSTTELQTIISKIMNYEKTPYITNTDWFENALLVGDPGSSGPSTISTNLYIKNIMSNYSNNYNFDEVYSSPFVSGIANGINSGTSYFNYRGYYNTSGWDNGDINSLNNGFMLPIVVIITCGTGDFNSSYGDALSEYFFKAGSATNPKGAVACIGTATLSTHTCFNNSVSAGIFTGIFVDGIYNMGGALARGKLGMYLNYPGNPGGWVNNFSYWNNLMGDPGMELWTGVPEDLVVSYDEIIALGSNNIAVNVTDLAGIPVVDTWVTVLKGDDEIFSSGYTDEEGNIYLPLTENVSGEVAITVTKHNFKPVSSTFIIVQQNQFLNVYDIIIDDDDLDLSSGNDDGLINPDEIIELNVMLKNFGLEPINGVTAEIASNNEYITIIDNNESYGDISNGEFTSSDNDFIIQIAPETPGGTQIYFDITISDNSGNTWEDRFELMINGPLLSYSDIDIIDSANGILDPGETAEINITLLNIGEIDISSLNADLICNDGRIEILDEQGYYEMIGAGEEISNYTDPFEINVDVQVIPGSQIWFDLHLYNDAGYMQDISFYIEIGSVNISDPLGPDAHGYYIYDDNDTNYSLVPVYNWFEIDPDYGGSGTILNLNDNGNTGDIEDVQLPNGFRFIYYGQEYEDLTVCTNGWIAPGGTDNFEFMNWHIPGLQGPSPMIAPFWDDLKTGNGNICYYYDEGNDRFLIEWSHMQNEYNNDQETFQVILYDSLVYPSLTGDSEILFQYKVINNVDQGSYNYGVQHGQYGSIGIEDQSSTIGLEYTFNNEYPASAATLHNEMALFITTNQAMIVDPPIAVIDHEEISLSVLQGETGNTSIQISNIGEANLVYNIHKFYIENENTVIRDQGGPDNYGYAWIDSNEENGPEFNWIDIIDNGTQIEFDHNDTGSDMITMDFDFDFYGITYNQFRINPNGWIGFGDDNSEWLNTIIPSPAAPRPAIMPYWDDLYPYDGELGGGYIYYYSTPESLIILFDNVEHFAGAHNGTYDFEVIIYPDGEILFQYNSVSGDTDTATIGLQNADGDDGLMVIHDNNYVSSGLAIQFKRVIDWLNVEPLSGIIDFGESESIELTVDSSDLLLGHFICDLVITTNDPLASENHILVNLYLATEEQNIYVDTENIDFGELEVEQTASDSFAVFNFGLDSLHVIDIFIDNPDFSMEPNGFTLGYNEYVDVVINFTPSSTGLIAGLLSITSDDPDEQIVYVHLSGAGLPGTGSDDHDIPLFTELKGNYPNPFNPTTSIDFALKNSGQTRLEIFNIKGEKIHTLVNSYLESGNYSYEWDGRDDSDHRTASGIYLYRLKTGNFSTTKKMLMLK